jgi:RTX calcium-binding nonapeptide repeat (4 copies)
MGVSAGRTRLTRLTVASVVAGTIVTLVVLAAGAAGAVNDTVLISRSDGLGANGANDTSETASTSADGRFVAFKSGANNLSADDNDSFDNVFVRDTQTNTTTLVSRQTGTAAMNGGNDNSGQPSISDDGRFVAFDSTADNLSGDDNNMWTNVFVRDLQTNTTTLVSRETGTAAMNGADDNSFFAQISGDGRFVAFSSYGDNLSADDIGTDSLDGFVRDTQANTTSLVSRQSGTTAMNGANGASVASSISRDGRFVAFRSDADNLSADDDNNFFNIFLRDTQANTTILVSRQSGTAAGNGADADSVWTSISADGRFVAFRSDADNLSAEDDNTYQNIFARDTQANTTTLVSRRSGTDANGADGNSDLPSISDDGRFVAFQSVAKNLSNDDQDNYVDIFERQFRDFDSAPPPGGGPGPSSAKCSGRAASKVGTAGRDVIVGTGHRDVIAALGGNDRVRAVGGNDLVCGGRGKDTVLGGRGRDQLLGQVGADILRGGRGRDLLKGGPGPDRLFGGPGRDRLAGGRGTDIQKQ